MEPMMRTAARQSGRQQASSTKSIPAPVGGWNARDSLALMPESDAVVLNNWRPRTTDVQLRKGIADWATGLTGGVNTLMAYSGPSAQKMFAIAGAGPCSVYDTTSSGPIGAAVLTGLTNSKWEYVNFSTPGGNFLMMVNGVDNLVLYNGSVWRTLGDGTGKVISSITSVGTLCTLTTSTAHNLLTNDTVTVVGATPAAYNGTFAITVTGSTTFTYVALSAPGGAAAPVGTYTYQPAISGINTNKFTNIAVFKNRIYFIEATSLRFWFLPTNSIGGAASSFDLGSVFRLGGHLVAMGTWSLDGGYGMDDYAVFITSNGEIAVYKGTDPTSSSTWSLIGVFVLGSPIGKRCFTKYQGDLILINKDGLVPLSVSLMSSRVNSRQNITDKIQLAISDATTNYGSNYGWEACLYPTENMLLLNIPVSTTAQQQYVMNTITGAWCSFSGWSANTWLLFNDEIYFGGATTVTKAWTGYSDNGAGIVSTGMGAFSYFGAKSQLKHFKEARPILTSTGAPQVNLTLNTDFNLTGYGGLISYTTDPTNNWGTGLWDNATWSGGAAAYFRDWEFIGGVGYSAVVQMVIGSIGVAVGWVSTDYVFEPGGIL